MDNLSGYAHRPLPFVLRYLRQRLASHLVIVTSVVAAVACSVGTQYGVKHLVDGLSSGASRAGTVWLAFVFLIALIAADNFLWRIASWTASFTFVGVTGDLRRDIFRHLTGHAPSYFSDRLPGMLTSRITATSNAVFTVENMFLWDVLPPCIASVAAHEIVARRRTVLISMLQPRSGLAVALVDFTHHFARLTEEIAPLLLPHELRDHPEAEPLVKAGAAIVFNKVSFRYPGGPQVFDKFSLRLNAGQRVGLVGQSGGGKSTVFTLLQRFYDVNQGHISIDGQNISRVTQESLRGAISVVPQDISMFHRSIMENVRYGRPTATDDEVLRAAIAARCDFVETLPEGLATQVGDRGVKLSCGQRQRIAIARAFLKDAPILLLHDATPALDTDSPHHHPHSLARLMRGRTVIAIAHRLATLRNFDRVIMLQGGRIIEDGPPDRLMQGQGPYRELVTQEMSRLAKFAA